VSEDRWRRHRLLWLVVVPAVAALIAFLVITPPELIAVAGNWFLAKPRMIGYAVCHQIPSHSFFICTHQLPLCARCTGTFAGALLGFFGQAFVLRRRRTTEFPAPALIAVLVGFTLLWAFDGANSYLGTIVRGPHLYEPKHELRVLTGALNGLTMSALVYPAFNVTFWRRIDPERGPSSFLLDAGSLLLQVVVSSQCIALYPLAWLSTLGVLALLTSVNTMLVLILIRRENVVDNWRGGVIPLLAGFAVSLIQIGAITLVRYTFTGSFFGLPLP
jgi:uncharacterized membrane protein